MTTPLNNQSAPRFTVIAHRGATTHQDLSRIRPENTLPAFAEAERQGAGIELDVMSTRDGAVVVHHDFKTGRIFRLSGPQKAIRQTDWSELKKARLNQEAHQGEMRRLLGNPHAIVSTQQTRALIPRLQTVLDQFSKTPLYVELKTTGWLGDGGLEAQVVDLIREKNRYHQVTVLSFSPLSLWRVKRLDSRVQTAYNLELPSWLKSRDWFLRWLVKGFAQGLLGVDAIHPSYGSTTPALVNLSHQAGLRVVPWVHGETRAQEREKFPQLMAMGVDGLITNAVDLLNAALRPSGSKADASKGHVD